MFILSKIVEKPLLKECEERTSQMSRWGMNRLRTKDSFSYLNYPRIQSEMVRETSGHRR